MTIKNPTRRKILPNGKTTKLNLHWAHDDTGVAKCGVKRGHFAECPEDVTCPRCLGKAQAWRDYAPRTIPMEEAPIRPTIGELTPRGSARIIARSSVGRDGWAVVLAIHKEGSEYVVWNESARVEYQSGTYAQVFGDAVFEFNRRREAQGL